MTTAKSIDLLIGKNLRKFREERKLSQATLARAFEFSDYKISRQQIQKYETGQNRVSASMLWKFAEVLKVEIKSFFTDATHHDH